MVDDVHLLHRDMVLQIWLSILCLLFFSGITFQSAGDGLLFSTQFQQPAILLAEKAAYEDLRAKGVIDGASPFAGHSLGVLFCFVFSQRVFLRLCSTKTVLDVQLLSSVVYQSAIILWIDFVSFL